MPQADIDTQENAPITRPGEPEVTVELARELGLLPEEFEKIKETLGRTPTFTEIGVYSVM